MHSKSSSYHHIFPFHIFTLHFIFCLSHACCCLNEEKIKLIKLKPAIASFGMHFYVKPFFSPLKLVTRASLRYVVCHHIQPSSRSVFSSSLERELRQSALVASSMPRPPFGTRSPMICVILNSPLAVLETN